jgi:hypothetical protein
MVPGDEEGGVACHWFVPQNFRIDDNYLKREPNQTIRDVTSTAMICFCEPRSFDQIDHMAAALE